MKVKIVLEEGAVLPEYAHPGSDAGLDLTAISRSFDTVKGFVEFDTGVRVEIPKGHVGLLFPRSSISKQNLTLTNCVGVIDNGYLGTIKLRFKKSTGGKGMYDVGDKVGQLIIMPIPQIEIEVVDSLEETERSTGGFGSTD